MASVFGEKLPPFLKKVVSVDNDSEDNSNNKLSPDLEKKIYNCFTRLQLILGKKNMTLYNVYRTYDGDKSGELSFMEFSKIIKRLDYSFSEDELTAVFELVDVDNSKSIEFRELNEYFCKVIGMPYCLYIPPEQVLEEKQRRMKYYQQKKVYERQQ